VWPARLFSPILSGTPGPKGPSRELIDAVVVMKHCDRNWGCPCIAAQISLAFGFTLDKDVVRRVLARYYQPLSAGSGPSWLTFLGHIKDSLWSVNLFRCESVTLKSHWGFAADGSVHASHHRIRRTCGHGRWPGAMSNVSMGDSRSPNTSIIELRPGSAVSISSVARQSPDTQNHVSQNRPVCAAVNPLCRATHRYGSS
jgi:hypothetical protein